MDIRDVGFRYGAACATLEKQANEQGYTLGERAEILEKIKYAINMCGFHVATASQLDAMTKKLHKKVMESLKPI